MVDCLEECKTGLEECKTGPTRKAVILAAGQGTRMRRPVAGARLTREQAQVAVTGVKGLIPIAGRPFLDYALHALAEAGIRQVCLVVSPGADALRSHYGSLAARRLEISFAVQKQPLGSADALLAAESFAAGEPFLIVNSDNFYPPSVLRALRDLGGSGLIAFDRARVLARGEGNVSGERMAAYAVLDLNAEGDLRRIVEKPDAATYASLKEPVLVSFNCWHLTSVIFTACRQVAPSSRGELELPTAVGYAIQELGGRFRAAISDEPVLDLSNQGDIESVEERLRHLRIDL